MQLTKLLIYTKNYFVLREFYHNTLGFAILHENTATAYCILDTGSFKLALQKIPLAATNKIKLSMAVADLKSTRLSLSSHFHPLPPLKIVEGDKGFDLKDPDGNELFIYEKGK